MASPTLHTEMFRKPEAAADGIARRHAADHKRTRSHVTGWTVAVGIAEACWFARWRSPDHQRDRRHFIAGRLAFAVRMATTIARGEMLHDP